MARFAGRPVFTFIKGFLDSGLSADHPALSLARLARRSRVAARSLARSLSGSRVAVAHGPIHPGRGAAQRGASHPQVRFHSCALALFLSAAPLCSSFRRFFFHLFVHSLLRSPRSKYPAKISGVLLLRLRRQRAVADAGCAVWELRSARIDFDLWSLIPS